MERWVTSFLGIRGIGSFFYLAFAVEQINFKYAAEIWSTVAFIVLLSILIHGLTAPRIMEKETKKSASEGNSEPAKDGKDEEKTS